MAKGAAEVEVEAGVKMESRICGLCGLPFSFGQNFTRGFRANRHLSRRASFLPCCLVAWVPDNPDARMPGCLDARMPRCLGTAPPSRFRCNFRFSSVSAILLLIFSPAIEPSPAVVFVLAFSESA